MVVLDVLRHRSCCAWCTLSDKNKLPLKAENKGGVCHIRKNASLLMTGLFECAKIYTVHTVIQNFFN